MSSQPTDDTNRTSQFAVVVSGLSSTFDALKSLHIDTKRMTFSDLRLFHTMQELMLPPNAANARWLLWVDMCHEFRNETRGDEVWNVV